MGKLNLKKITALLICCLIISEYFALMDNERFHFDEVDLQDEDHAVLSDFSIYTGNYLFLSEINSSQYRYTARGECYLLAEIENMGYSSLTLDGDEYELTYGLNFIPKRFGDEFTNHTLEIFPTDLQYFNFLCVEPMFLAQGIQNTTLNCYQSIEFRAAGPISILIKPHFLYNWLYVQVDNVTLKNIFNTTEYPEVYSALFATMVQGGSYVRFDIDVEPGMHRLKIKGNGTLEYKIVMNLDFDGDKFSDADEVHQEGFYDLDPTLPDTWGFFEKSEEGALFEGPENSFLQGYFSFYLPKCGCPTPPLRYLYIDVSNGNFSDFEIDGDPYLLQDKVLYADYPTTAKATQFVKSMNPGWHSIRYQYNSTEFANISFRVNTENIKVIRHSELIDTDGDGIKDWEELSNGLNLYDVDTDDDGLPDNFDASPLVSLSLEKDKITQIVIPAHSQNNTLINIQIQKPSMDYSCTSRIWRDKLNVSIFPALRLYGNSTITSQQLESEWGKTIDSYSLVEGYNCRSVGDPLPGDSPNDEFTFIYAKPSQTTFEFDLTFPKGHPAKLDDIIDLRFDFVWIVTSINESSKRRNPIIVHYYDFEEDVIVQTMTTREISNVSYILATPDSMIDNYLLWALVQNPTLGSPSQFNVNEDIIGQGNVDYLDLAKQTLLDRQHTPKAVQDTEVLYVSGLEGNYDVLNNLKAKESQLDFAAVHSGDYEAFFSFYTVSNVYEEYKFGNPQIQGETKILYQTFHYNFTTTLEKRANILGMPINMELLIFPNSQVLKITRAIGSLVPLDDIPHSIHTNIDQNLRFWHQTFIEPTTGINVGIPVLNFNNSIHVYKEFYDIRSEQVNVSDLFFTHHSPMPASILTDFLKEFQRMLWDYKVLIGKIFTESSGIKGISNARNLLYWADINTGNLYSALDPTVLDPHNLQTYDDMIGAISTFQEKGIRDLGAAIGKLQPKVSKGTELDEMLNQLRKDNIKVKQMAERAKIKLQSERSQQPNNPKACNPACESGVEEGISTGKTLAKLKGIAIGAASIAIGVFCLYAGIMEMYNLLANIGEYEGRVLEFALRMASALATVALGVCAITLGVVVFAGTFGKISAAAAQSAVSYLGKVIWILAIVIAIFEIGTLISRAVSGELQGAELTFEIVKLAITLGFALALPMAIAAATSSTGYGALAGAVIAVISLLTAWITTLINHPDMNITSSEFLMPTRNITKRGSLTVGDQVTLRLDIENPGDRDMWFISRFALGGPTTPPPESSQWTPWAGRWADSHPYYPSNKDTLYMPYTLTDPTPDLHYHIDIRIDAWITEIIIIVPWSHRVEFARDVQSHPMNTFVLDKKISAFYDDTVESVDLEELFQEALDEYRYKDAFDTANLFIASIENDAGISTSEYTSLAQRLQSYDATSFLLHTSSSTEFSNLIIRFYDEGFRAKQPIPIYLGYSEFDRNLYAYQYSNGDILIPKSWYYSKGAELAKAFTYINLRNQLPLKTNIKLNITERLIDIDPISGTTVTLNLILKGPDNPIVDYELILPDEFSVSPAQFSQHLISDISFHLIPTSPTLMGVYYFEVKMYLDGLLIFDHADIPLRIRTRSDLRFEAHQPAHAIDPGETFNLVNLMNFGNKPEQLRFIVQGLPSNFINRTLHPDDFTDDFTQVFVLSPDDLRACLIVTPPRHYTTAPTSYIYNVVVRDQLTEELYYSYTDSFHVKKFHEVEVSSVQGHPSNRPGTPSTVECQITNHGNSPEHLRFNVYADGWDPSLFRSLTALTITPGETLIFDIVVNVEREPLLFPGDYDLTIEIVGDTGVLAVCSTTLEILDFHDILISGEDVVITDGTSEIVGISIQNLGNVQDTFTITTDHLGVLIYDTQIVSNPTITLDPLESQMISVRIDPFELGTEIIRLNVSYFNYNGELIIEYSDFNVTTIDDDIQPPIVVVKYLDDLKHDFSYYYKMWDAYRQIPLGPNTEYDISDKYFKSITDGYYAENSEYQKYWFYTYDPSGIDLYTISLNNQSIVPQLTRIPRLIYPLSTQNTDEFFYVGGYRVNVKRELLYAPDDESNAGYFTLYSRQSGGYPQIEAVEVELNGEVLDPVCEEVKGGTLLNLKYPLPREPGTHEVKIHIQYHHYKYPYTYHYISYHTVHIANCTGGIIQIPLQVDDPSTPTANEGAFNFSIFSRDNDTDNLREYDKLSTEIAWAVQVFDDDIEPPIINISALQISVEDLYDPVFFFGWNMTEDPIRINDSLAQYGFPRWVRWLLSDKSGFRSARVTYEVRDFDGAVLFPETLIFSDVEYGVEGVTDLGAFFICTLVPGYHRFQVTCWDDDSDRADDELFSSKDYVLTIQDDDVEPLELLDLTINSSIRKGGVPMVELEAIIPNPEFAENPSQQQFLIFVDDQWVPDVVYSYELNFNETVTPPRFNYATVKFSFENIWEANGLMGNHTVEIVTADDDYDVLYQEIDPFYPYRRPNYEVYKILQMTSNISLYDVIRGEYTDPSPESLENFFYNQTILYTSLLRAIHPVIILTPDFINLFGFPPVNFTITGLDGTEQTQSYTFSPFFSAILPNFYSASQLFFILIHNSILNNYHIPWDKYNESLISFTRNQLDIPLSLLNFNQKRPSIRASPLFDGLFIDYTMDASAMEGGSVHFAYTHLIDSNFQVLLYSPMGATGYHVDSQTRTLSSGGGLFGDATHSPTWIFTNTSLGDFVPVVVNGVGDYLFNVTCEILYELPDTGFVEVWVLEDLNETGSIAWYEKSTGLLVKGTFYYGQYYYSLDLLKTNKEFITVPNEHVPTLLGSSVTPGSGDQLTAFRFTATYYDLDNAPPAYMNVIINGTPYDMEKQDPGDTNYIDGCTFQYYTYLDPGVYEYTFTCSDRDHIVSSEIYTGLRVFQVENVSITRETLVLTIYPELLFGTSTLFQALANDTKIFNPTERLTITYDLATGIALHFLLEHLADPTDPSDTNITHLEAVLDNTNILFPYEFKFHNQPIPTFVPSDASLQSFFTTFEVVRQYGLNASVEPTSISILDDETALLTLNISNIGNLEDSYLLSVAGLSLGTSIFSSPQDFCFG